MVGKWRRGGRNASRVLATTVLTARILSSRRRSEIDGVDFGLIGASTLSWCLQMLSTR